MRMRLKDKAALVIGGSGGIGGSIAAGFAAEGARVGIIGRRQEKVDDALSSLRKSGTEAAGQAADLNGAQACAEAIDKIAGIFGGLDILVNSQGITVFKSAAELSEEDYNRVIGVNLNSVFFCCQAAYCHMRGKGGAIINIASLAGYRGWPLAIPYAISKHGVLAITRTLGVEWAKEKVRVNSISPGYYKTELTSAMSPARVEVATAPELAGAAVFLASDDASYVTGTDVAVDGGFLARGI